MKAMTVAKLKARFSEVIEDLRRGEEITIEYGKSHKKLGVIIPYDKYKPAKRTIGIAEKQASYEIKGDFKMSDEELSSL